MIALLFLLSAATVTPAPVDDEIVVMASRAQTVEITLGRDDAGKIACGVGQSSGDVRIDGMVCKDSAGCLKLKAATPDQISACIEGRKPRLVGRITAQLRKKRNRNA